jgi:hypothetical protein
MNSNSIVNVQNLDKKMNDLFLDNAEKPIDGSPTVTLKNGSQCIPQHFYTFNHTLESVKKLLKRISFSNKFNPYVFEDKNVICLQIEIIGHENYHYANSKRDIKKVYGRKWRIEKNLPTSEIIQTAMLAIKIAIEHELRELLKLKDTAENFISTPFNNHQDLPLICKEHRLLECDKEALDITSVYNLLDKLSFNKQEIQIIDLSKHKDIYILEIKYAQTKTRLNEINFFSWFSNMKSTVILQNLSSTEILHVIMKDIISLSNQFVEDHFLFDGVARFSKIISPIKISKLAIQTRKSSSFRLKKEIKKKIKFENLKVDLTRIPLSLRI